MKKKQVTKQLCYKPWENSSSVECSGSHLIAGPYEIVYVILDPLIAEVRLVAHPRRHSP